MDERDKDLTELFVRDLDEIKLPPRGAWRRASRRESVVMHGSRYFLTAGAVVAVLAIALLVGLQLRDRNTTAVGPSASPTSSASGATVVNPTPSSTAGATLPSGATPAPGGAVYDDDFGFIVTNYGGFNADLRTESGTPRQGLQGLSFSSEGFAVSADGKFVAYWTLRTNSEPSQLRIFTSLGNSREQTLVTLAAGQRAGGIVWSSDGAGLLYSTETGTFGFGGGTNSATLNIYEIATNGRHGTTIDTQTNTGLFFRPIAWDRSANLAAAGMTGEGGFMGKYVTVRTTPDNSFTASRTDMNAGSIGMGSVHASSDAKVVFGVIIGGGPPSIAYWPLADISSRRTTGAGMNSALWQPGTHKIGYIGADGSFILFRTDDGSATIVFTGVKTFTNIATFRADGSAVLLAAHEAPGAGSTEFTLYRLPDGASVTFQEVVGPIASVRFR